MIMSTAWKKTLRDILIVFVIGFIYYLIVRFLGQGITCVFYTLTGLPCPSCGITRMFICLSQFRFADAFHYNQFLFFTWPFLATECIYIDYTIESNKDIPKWNVIVIVCTAVSLLAFGILRILYHL